MMKKAGIIVLISATFAACTGTDKVTQTSNGSTVKKKVACADIHVDMGQTHIDWFEEKSNVFNNSEEVLVLPKEYEVYSVDSGQAAAFFNEVGNNKQQLATVVPLPKPAGCQLFTFKNNKKDGAVAPAGNAYTLGVCMEQEMILNYQNGKMSGMVEWFDLVYEILPIEANGNLYYIIYQKQLPDKNSVEQQKAQPNLQMVEYKPVK